jgi:hypothetical protein
VVETRSLRLLFSVLVTSATLLVGGASSAEGQHPAAVVEVTSPSDSDVGADPVALRTAAESEVRRTAASFVGLRRPLVISLAVSQTGASPIVCNVNATVRDARTGAMIAVVETDARSDGPGSSEQRRQIAYAAVRNAVRRVPQALRSH